MRCDAKDKQKISGDGSGLQFRRRTVTVISVPATGTPRVTQSAVRTRIVVFVGISPTKQRGPRPHRTDGGGSLRSAFGFGFRGLIPLGNVFLCHLRRRSIDPGVWSLHRFDSVVDSAFLFRSDIDGIRHVGSGCACGLPMVRPRHLDQRILRNHTGRAG